MFQGGVESTNDEDIDLLMGVKTPGADNLLGGKKEPKEKDPEVIDPVEDLEEDPVLPKGKKANIKVEDETPAVKAAKKPVDEVTDELFGKEDAELDEEGNPKPKPKVAPVKKVASPSTEVGYKELYEMLVADGVFGEVETPADFKWDAEGFKEIQKLQVTTQYNDLLDKTGPYGKAIIEYEKNGGNTGELINLFREQRTVQEFDVTTPEGQEEFLTSYLEAQGYSVKSIDRTIKALIDQGADALKEEAEEKKTLWDDQYKQEIEGAQQQQKLVAQQMAEQARNFTKTISDTLTADPDLTPAERKTLGTYILSYTQKFNGNDVSQFYSDMAEIQKDPAAYVELAKFIKGLKTGEYKKKIEARAKREVSAKTFLKVKNGNALSQRDGGAPELNDDTESSFVSYLSGKK